MSSLKVSPGDTWGKYVPFVLLFVARREKTGFVGKLKN